MTEPMHIFTLSSFNLQNFNATLKKEFDGAKLESVEYGQMFPFLLGLNGEDKEGDICICWISLRDLFQAKEMKIDLTDLIIKLNQSFQYSVVILPSVDSAAFNVFQGHELRTKLYKLNLSLSERSKGTNMAILDATGWLVHQGSNAISSPLWYLSKTPFHKNVFKLAAAACKSTINAFTGNSKKVLVVDLDDTLWGGIVGDEGIENIKIGGHDGVGEAFADFQRWIQMIGSWGVILCICSKNDEKIALEVFENHSGMILKKEDFVKWRINWNDKAENISEMISELNVSMDSVVFLDDSAVERNRIRTALPEILVPDLPEDKLEYPSFIRSLDCFNSISLTQEDIRRTALYKEEERRSETSHAFVSVDDWIGSLQIELKFEVLSDSNLVRAEQLLNKTNQMNLRTRRMSKEELKSWASQNNHWFYVVEVNDRFGANGITGLLGFHQTEKNDIFIDDFVMSCRIMGRKIEDKMLNFIVNKAKENDGNKVLAHYMKTEKNKPVFDFFNSIKNDCLIFEGL